MRAVRAATVTVIAAALSATGLVSASDFAQAAKAAATGQSKDPVCGPMGA